MREVHQKRITREDLVDNTKIIHYETRPKRLRVLEAVYIHLSVAAIALAKNIR